MIITRIKLKNWKNFGEVDVACDKRVFLIGPNASGKSNFLDALRFLRDVAEDGLEKAVESRGGMKAIRWLGARQQPAINISVTLDKIWEYSLSFDADKKSKLPIVVEEIVRHGTGADDTPKWKTVLRRPDKYDDDDTVRLTQTALQQVNANKAFREIPEFFSSIQYRHILPQLVRDPKGFSPSPISNDPFGRDLVFQIWKTPGNIRKSRLDKVNKALRIAVPKLSGLTVIQDDNGLPHLQVRHEHWRPQGAKQVESSLSDGTLRLLTLLWTLLDTGGPLLLEEPELSLHEEIVRQLPLLFAKLDRGKKKETRQVFITTHAQAMLEGEGIGANETLVLEPGAEGTKITAPTAEERKLILEGLSVAEVLLPRTKPADLQQLSLFSL